MLILGALSLALFYLSQEVPEPGLCQAGRSRRRGCFHHPRNFPFLSTATVLGTMTSLFSHRMCQKKSCRKLFEIQPHSSGVVYVGF